MTEYKYKYKREYVNNNWNIENNLRIDAEKNNIQLSKEVEALIPGFNFKLLGSNNDVVFCFDKELSTEQEQLLTDAVTAHKNNT